MYTDEDAGYETHAHMYGQLQRSWTNKHTLIAMYLSVRNVWLTVRASPRATPPSVPILFRSRLQLETDVQ